jgi:hypothetical protein
MAIKFLIFGLVVLAIYIFTSVFSSRERAALRKQATKLVEDGEWQKAASAYKKQILEYLSDRDVLLELTGELESIYKQQDIQADLKKIMEIPGLREKIEGTKASEDEKRDLYGKLMTQANEILNKYPGDI